VLVGLTAVLHCHQVTLILPVREPVIVLSRGDAL
jgi:hypothetical protein